MVDDGEGNKVVNPEYVKFSQQDSSLASWLLASISSAIRKGLVGCMTATSIWSKLHQHFLSPSTSCKMNIHDRLKVRKLFNQSMREYLTNIQLICDIPAGCGLPIKEMQQTSIILNGVKVQYNNVVFVIHANWNPYDLASISSVFLYVEARQRELMFDNSLVAANVMVKPSSEHNLKKVLHKDKHLILDRLKWKTLVKFNRIKHSHKSLLNSKLTSLVIEESDVENEDTITSHNVNYVTRLVT